MRFVFGSTARRYSLSAVLLATAGVAVPVGTARAQQPGPAASEVESVVVTGTSIRGAAPVGSNLISIDRSAIEQSAAQTSQQILAGVPQISTTFGTAGQGSLGADSDSGAYSPSIHSLGGSGSQATLVLVNGHRIPPSGMTVMNVDPTAVPSIMLQRVEVLPDGASSVYGSDAVAGVINFVTRQNFTGMETHFQSGIASHYQTFDGSALFGYDWHSGSVMAAYEYSSRSNLSNGSRDFITARQDVRRGATDPSQFTGIAANPPAGAMTTTPSSSGGTNAPFGATIPYPSSGTNFQTFACPVATIAASSSAPAYYYPYNGQAFSTSTSGVPSQGACDNINASTALPSEVRNNFMVSLRQDINDRLSVNVDMYYASRLGSNRLSRGTVSATVFGPSFTSATTGTTQRNPFYVGNAATGTTSEFINFDFNQLLGPGAYQKTGTQNVFLTTDIRYTLGGDREFVISGSAGKNFNSEHFVGIVPAASALLALNGTTNTSGNPTANSEPDIYGLGTTYVGSRALTTSNALDVWNPVGSNRTSAAVLTSLRDGGYMEFADQGLQDVVAKFDGSIFDLPAGPVKASVGGEFLHQVLSEYGTTNNLVGPSSSNSASFNYQFGREIYSAFVEFLVPIISPDAGVPLMRSLTLNVSGRYDRFNAGIGDTKNPKVGVNWELAEGIKARGSFSTSFVAPDVHHLGTPRVGANSESQVLAAATPNNPVIPFGVPNTYNGGAGTAATWVGSPATCAAGGGTVVNAGGSTVAAPFTGAYACRVAFAATNGAGTSAAIRYSGGNPNLRPATGTSYSAGLDLDFGSFLPVLDGLLVNLTYYQVKYANLHSNTNTQSALPSLTYFAPPGGYSLNDPVVQNAITGRPVGIALPSTIYAVFDGREQNAYTLWQNGLDFQARYRFETADAGNFTVGLSGNQIFRFAQQAGTLPIVDIKNGKNSGRFVGIELTSSADIGWDLGNWSSNLRVNYTHPYSVPDTRFPYNLVGPNRVANTAHIGADITGDLNVAYNIPDGWLGLPDVVASGSQLSVTVQNVLDSDPPFNAASTSGYGQADPIGRLVTFGWRKTW